MKRRISRLVKGGRQGATSGEYTMIVGVVAILATVALSSSGDEVTSTFSGVTNKVYSAASKFSEPLVAADDQVVMEKNQSIKLYPLANDGDLKLGGGIVDVTDPSRGSLVRNGTRFTYTPDTDYTGNDSFRYTIADRRGEETDARVDIRITGPCGFTSGDSTGSFASTCSSIQVILSGSGGDGGRGEEGCHSNSRGGDGGRGGRATIVMSGAMDHNFAYDIDDVVTLRAEDGTVIAKALEGRDGQNGSSVSTTYLCPKKTPPSDGNNGGCALPSVGDDFGGLVVQSAECQVGGGGSGGSGGRGDMYHPGRGSNGRGESMTVGSP